VRTEYGLAKIVEPSKVIIHNDDYMLRELQHSHYKMRSMEKYFISLFEGNKKIKTPTSKMLANNPYQSPAALINY
jgi:predicted transcriptional regulator